LYGKNTKFRRFDKKKVAHFGEIVIKMYRTEMMNSEYLVSRQNDPTIHQKRKKIA
jgi:hypothetical protein